MFDLARAFETVAHAVEGLVGDTPPYPFEVGRNHPAGQQPVARSDAEAADVQRFPHDERRARADDMDACHQAPHPFQDLRVAEFGCATALPGKYRETETAVAEQGLSAQHQGRHHRQFVRCHRRRECMFLGDLRVAPASRPVELGDQRRTVIDADLPDAVLVAVERQQGAVATQAEAFDGIEDALRDQARERKGKVGAHGTAIISRTRANSAVARHARAGNRCPPRKAGRRPHHRRRCGAA